MGAFAAAVVLTLAKVADEKPAIQAMPWSVIVMVSGVTVLTSLLQKTGGIDLFTTLLARLATHRTVYGTDRVRHRTGLGLQQHVGRGVAGVSAERSGAGRQAWAAATRWRSRRRS